MNAKGRGGWRRGLRARLAALDARWRGWRAVRVRSAAKREAPFWERKSLAEMTRAEWESLCDGCGRCCVLKLQDADTDDVRPTAVACRLLDLRTCRCRHYKARHALVPECLPLSAETLSRYRWLPTSCAYRRVHEGRGLAWWHPLVSGDPATVRRAGVSVRGSVISEDAIHPNEPLEAHLIRWVDAAEQPPP